MNDQYIGVICQGCGERLKSGDKIVVCNDCGTPQHFTCYIRLCKCSMPGCMGAVSSSLEIKDEDEIPEEKQAPAPQPVVPVVVQKELEEQKEKEKQEKARKNAEALQELEEAHAKKTTKKLIVLSALGAVLLAFIIWAICEFAIPRWEDAMDVYVDVISYGSRSSFLEIAPEQYWDLKLAKTSLTFEDIECNAYSYTGQIEGDWNDRYGYGYEYSYEVLGEIEWSDYQCKQIERMLIGHFEIDSGYTIIMNITILGYKDGRDIEERAEVAFDFVKIDGQYYMIEETSRGYNFVVDSLLESSERFKQDCEEYRLN